MRQGDLARVGPVAPSHQPGMADGVMRGAERAVPDQRRIRWKLVGHRVNAGDVQGLRLAQEVHVHYPDLVPDDLGDPEHLDLGRLVTIRVVRGAPLADADPLLGLVGFVVGAEGICDFLLSEELLDFYGITLFLKWPFFILSN